MRTALLGIAMLATAGMLLTVTPPAAASVGPGIVWECIGTGSEGFCAGAFMVNGNVRCIGLAYHDGDSVTECRGIMPM